MLDLLLRDVDVRTVDDDRPRATAVGVLGGRIVGLDEDVTGLPARTVVDGQGAVVVPGLGTRTTTWPGSGSPSARST